MNVSKLISRPKRWLPTDIPAAMTDLTYEYDPSVAPLRAVDAGDTQASRASKRSVFLPRLLLAADVASAALAGVITSFVFAVPLSSAAALMAVLIAGSILLAFVFGLYSDGDLLTWASGLADAPRALAAALVLSWPVLGIATALDLP